LSKHSLRILPFGKREANGGRESMRGKMVHPERFERPALRFVV
jgi:hypothetical protein